jgi:AraC-like DNA-binding protein
MEDFFKYLAPGEDDINWGLYLNVVGKTVIQPGLIYPNLTHPSGYFFTWEKGRVLHEYQLIYISEGSGIYEDENSKFPIIPGSLLILQPSKWHRYKPDIAEGWTENYIGFNGPMADLMFTNPHLAIINPIFHIGNLDVFIETYYNIFRFARDEKPGFQQITAGMVMKLLGNLISIEKRLDFSEKRIEKIIEKACFLIRENIEKEIDFKQYADDNCVAYSYFRRMFKLYTGLPPAKYHLDLKIIRSRELLLSTDKIIKEICSEVGFESTYYFSRLFKKKTGISPSRFRTSANYQKKQNKIIR